MHASENAVLSSVFSVLEVRYALKIFVHLTFVKTAS